MESGDWKYISSTFPLDFAWQADSSGLAVIESKDGQTLVLRDTGGRMEWDAGLDSASGEVGGCGGAIAISQDGRQVAILSDVMSQGTAAASRSSRILLLDTDDGHEIEQSPEWTTDMSQDGAYPCGNDLAWTGTGELAVVSHHGPGVNDIFWLDPLNDWMERGERTPGTEAQLAAYRGSGLVAVLASVPHSGLVLSLIIDGRTQEAVTAGYITGFDFSPDGSKLAVSADGRLLIIDVASGSAIDSGELQTQGLSWGANDRIAVAWGGKVESIRPDGSDRQSHVDLGGGRAARSPLWSPDATHIAFVVEPPYRD